MKQNIITTTSIAIICIVLLVMISGERQNEYSPCLVFVTEEGVDPKIWTSYDIYSDKKMVITIGGSDWLDGERKEFTLSDYEFEGIMFLANRINDETRKNHFVKDNELIEDIKSILKSITNYKED